ncbi:MAG: hypothetical protein ACRD4C_01645 [Candidatus Acidiferrales bacterium]
MAFQAARHVTTGTKYLLLSSAFTFVVMALFELNISVVLAAGGESGFWGFAWPPFVGHRYVVISPGLRNASLCLLLISTAILVIGAVWSVSASLKSIWMKRKSVKPKVSHS